MKRRSTLLFRLRAEARATFHALLLLLFVPVLHPVAEAHAIQNGTASIICSTFGAIDGDPEAATDNLPDCLACALAAVGLPPATTAPAVAAGHRDLQPSLPTATIALANSARRLPPATGPPSLS